MNDQILERRAQIGQERRNRTREKLIAAAAQVVASRGERNATIDDFIQAAGVARGTFYNYFSTREQILDALWERIGKNPFKEIQKQSESLKDPAERIAIEARLVLEQSAVDSVWGWLVFSLSADAETVNTDLLTFPVPDLRAGFKSGRFRYQCLESARDLVVGALRSGIKTQLSEKTPENYKSSMCKMILVALGVSDFDAEKITQKPLPSSKKGRNK